MTDREIVLNVIEAIGIFRHTAELLSEPALDKAATVIRLAISERLKEQVEPEPTPHVCQCGNCEHVWTATNYPNVCPKCGTAWI